MLDLTGLPALDLAIGLAFIFFLLSTLAATIQEFIAAIFGLRARTLEQGLRSMLEDPDVGWTHVDRFYDHDLIKSLYRTPPPDAMTEANAAAGEKATADENAKPSGTKGLGKNAGIVSRRPFERALHFFERTKGPSYISPRSFALVLLDNFAPKEKGKTIIDAGDEVLDNLPAGLRERLRPLIAGPQKGVEELRTNLEAWFDDAMARVSGWYKRKTQIILIVIGIILVPAINANTIKMGERMWEDDTVRAAVVAQAQEIASDTPTTDAAEPSAAATPTPDGAELSEAAQRLNTAADDIDDVVKVGIPMGWRGEAVPRGLGEILIAIAGWLLTILAISLGAPFWFDALGRLSRLRSTGKPETPLPATGSGKRNERVLTPPQVPTVVLRHDVTPPGPPTTSG